MGVGFFTGDGRDAEILSLRDHLEFIKKITREERNSEHPTDYPLTQHPTQNPAQLRIQQPTLRRPSFQLQLREEITLRVI